MILPLLCGALSACSASPDAAAIGQSSQPIFRGSLDTEHPEVMFLFDLAGFACTGTNIRSADGSGFLLTAAHCVTEAAARGPGVVPVGAERFVVVPGEDAAESTDVYPAEAVFVEPGYDGGFAEDDVAVVRYFFDDDAPPPTIEPLTPEDDDLAPNDGLTLVGYGQTEEPQSNTERRTVERRVGDLADELVAFDQSDGVGACFGDSGGPGLVQVNGQERVGLVISGGVDGQDQPPCEGGFTLGMRVSAYDDFIRGALDEELPQAFAPVADTER
jgi:secreted trypsin-like serine protease